MPEIDPVPLAELTTLRTGGMPTRLVVAETRDELVAVLRDVWSSGERWLVVGGGSNLFVGDEPFDGTVVLVRTRGIRRESSPREGFVRLVVGAGEDWDGLVAETVRAGLAGIEAMSGIPGTVGGAVIQNIGAYGQDLSQTLVEVDLIDENGDEVVRVAAGELELGFRTSALKHHYGGTALRSAVVDSVTLELRRAGHGPIALGSAQLRAALSTDSASLAEIREQVRALRARSGMLWSETDPDSWGVGSFMQNAIVSDAFVRTLPSECPRWRLHPDRDETIVIPLDRYLGVIPVQAGDAPDWKLSSAWLIEHAGIPKGFRLPGSRAAVSDKHALAITNRGGATAEEVAELARFIRERVHSEFGLRLHVEPTLVGVEI